MYTNTLTADPDVEPAVHRPESARLWIGRRRWDALLADLRHDTPAPNATPGGASDATGHRHHARHAVPLRCILRLAPPDPATANGSHPQASPAHGTYLVHARNLGRGGLNFVHDRPLTPGTRATLALQPVRGPGRVLRVAVAWCRPVENGGGEPGLFHVGLKFDRPLVVGAFLPAA